METNTEYDYTETNKPITFEVVRSQVIKELQKGGNIPSDVEVDMLTNQIMFNLWSTITYLGENYEVELNQIRTFS